MFDELTIVNSKDNLHTKKYRNALLREAVSINKLEELFANNPYAFCFNKMSFDKLCQCVVVNLLSVRDFGDICSKNSGYAAKLFLQHHDKWSYDILMKAGLNSSVLSVIGENNISLFREFSLPFHGLSTNIIAGWLGNSLKDKRDFEYLFTEVKKRMLGDGNEAFKSKMLCQTTIVKCLTEEELLRIPIRANLLMRGLVECWDQKSLTFSVSFVEEIKKRIFKEVLAGKYKNSKRLNDEIKRLELLTLPQSERGYDNNSRPRINQLSSYNIVDPVKAYSSTLTNMFSRIDNICIDNIYIDDDADDTEE